MSQHRSRQREIEDLINARGAFVLWNPPSSPDLNPIEKLWDVVVAACKRRMFELAAAMGLRRKLNLEDVAEEFWNARLSLHAYASIFGLEFA